MSSLEFCYMYMGRAWEFIHRMNNVSLLVRVFIQDTVPKKKKNSNEKHESTGHVLLYPGP